MTEALFYYLFLLSLGGFLVLGFFSILAFVNSERLQIKEARSLHSGILLLTNGVIYLLIAVFLKLNQSRRLVKALTM